jgi:hypothetical protein
MVRKTSIARPPLEPHRGVGTDYALLAIGIGTAVVALIYLIVI